MNPGANSFSFLTVLSGINKTLGVAKEVIPLWQQTKPLINNMRTAYTLIKNVNTNKNTKQNSEVNNQKQLPNNISINTNKQLTEKTIIKSNNSPQFFI